MNDEIMLKKSKIESNASNITENKYEMGKIYCLKSNQTKKIYIGSTILKLNIRFNHHTSSFRRYLEDNISNNYTAFEILKYSDAHIELIESYPCKNRKDLLKREGFYIRKMNQINVNERIEGRTEKEKKETNKKSYKKNKDKIKERKKKYWEENKDKIKECNKKYHEENKEKIKERKKKYWEENKEKFSKKAKEKYKNKKLNK
jgi:hypothetical protein